MSVATSFAQLQKVGYGLMNFTWVASRKFSPEQFNSILKEVLDSSSASPESPLFINGGEFYGVPDRFENLRLLGGFFQNHPQYADKVYLSIKGGTNAMWGPDTSRSNLITTINNIDKYLEPLYSAREALPKKLDMFTLTRVGKEPIEQTMDLLKEKKDKGKFSSICLSEVSATTLARALSVGEVQAVELEFSLFHREPVNNHLFNRCVEFDIPVVCYSPLGKGLLVGQTASDLAKDDWRHSFDKFKNPDVIKNNQTLVDRVKQLAASSNLTPAQLALSWITTLSGTERRGIHYPQLLPIPGSTNPDRQLNNLDVVTLGEDTMAEIDSLLESFKTAGARFNKLLDQYTYR